MNNEGQVADIYTLKLTIYQSTSEDKDATVYIGQHYTDKEYPDVFDFDVTAETPTTMYYTFTNAYGCDHVVTLNLTILDPGICTKCNSDRYYSYRASDGPCGRHSAIAFREQAPSAGSSSTNNEKR